MKKEYRTFEDAKKFVTLLNLPGSKEWAKYCKSGKKPDDIPTHPHVIYKNKGWKGIGDWVGTGRIADKNKIFNSFLDTKQFVHNLKIKSFSEWREYCKSGKKPDDIPSNPNRVYKNEWKGWGEFLGNGHIRNYRSFDDAKQFAQSLQLKNSDEWRVICKSGKKPDDIPASPNKVYKKEWKGFGDWLGTGNTQTKKFRDIIEAKKFVQTIGIKSAKEWQEYCTSGKKPDDIPSKPQEHFKNKGWKGWGEFLGTGRIADQNKSFRSFDDARKFVHTLELRGDYGWREYCKSGKKPDDIPSVPARVYKDKGWKGFGDWLGTGVIATQQRKYRSFSEAKKFIRSLGIKSAKEWQEYCTSGKKPDDIPSSPWNIYKKWEKK